MSSALLEAGAAAQRQDAESGMEAKSSMVQRSSNERAVLQNHGSGLAARPPAGGTAREPTPAPYWRGVTLVYCVQCESWELLLGTVLLDRCLTNVVGNAMTDRATNQASNRPTRQAWFALEPSQRRLRATWYRIRIPWGLEYRPVLMTWVFGSMAIVRLGLIGLDWTRPDWIVTKDRSIDRGCHSNSSLARRFWTTGHWGQARLVASSLGESQPHCPNSQRCFGVTVSHDRRPLQLLVDS
ncbi:unnamed protein product [Calypogeia fissa]